MSLSAFRASSCSFQSQFGVFVQNGGYSEKNSAYRALLRSPLAVRRDAPLEFDFPQNAAHPVLYFEQCLRGTEPVANGSRRPRLLDVLGNVSQLLVERFAHPAFPVAISTASKTQR
jgi:hypothetical protein